MDRLRHRAQFLAAAAGTTAPETAFVLQARDRRDDGPPRVGFTVSRKVGNAVERNRVRRRLKAIARRGQAAMRPGHDYVFVGRRAALDLPFERLAAELDRALRRIHGSRAERARQK
ncbi:MAG TPA: ribonuclease P protein component [Xanthobacteraceae bacterium]|nr:ribonuclease P protein component [Xanthobacteraceae bacterium]